MRTLFLAVAVLLLLAGPVAAEAPSFVPLQGYLAHQDGKPVSGTVSVRFALYLVPQGGISLWEESQEVSPQDGLFTTFLGFKEPLDLALFAQSKSIWLGITVEKDSEMQRVFLGTVPFAALAQHCETIPAHAHQIEELKNVAKAGQLCSAGTIVNGIDANGNLLCQAPGNGGSFALAAQYCPANNVMTGIDSNGYPVCVPANSGSFALAGQNCSSGKVVTGINSSGGLVCDSAGGGIAGDGTSNRLALWKSSSELKESVVTESSGKIGINNTSPAQTLDVKGNLKVSGEFHWGGNKFGSSSCLVVGGSSCSSACSAHGMSCYKAFRIDGPSTGDSCSQSGFKFCCCTD